MNIIACSYTNIGPFAGRTLSLVIHPGASMIIAPVGTGKSMLFFDGIVYGLYKYSTRDVLNVAASEGVVSILYELHGEYWLVRRMIKASKSRSFSVVSSLARYHGSIDRLYEQYPEIVLYDCDVCGMISQFDLDVVTFKNESDLQRELEQLLPPRDVFMNRDMMMQESSNIFDLTQSQRIEVFKHLFGLLDIDGAKERLTEEKAKLKYTLQIKKDTTQTTAKCTTLITQLQQLWSQIITSPYYYEDEFGAYCTQWLKDAILLDQTRSIDSLPLLQWGGQGYYKQLLVTHTEGYRQISVQYQGQQDLISKTKESLKSINQLLEQSRSVSRSIVHEIARYDDSQIQGYKTEKLTLIQERNDIEFGVQYELFDDSNIEDYQQAYDTVHQWIQQGKEIQLQITNLESHATALQDKFNLEQKHYQQQLEQIIQQQQQLDQQLEQKQQQVGLASTFYCQKIEADCPFVATINHHVIESRRTELTLLLQQKTDLDHRYQLAQQSAPHSIDEHYQRIQQQKVQLEQHIVHLRKKMIHVGFKSIVDHYPRFQAIQLRLRQLDQILVQAEQLQQQQEKLKQQLHESDLLVHHYEKEFATLTSQLHQYEHNLVLLTQQYRTCESEYHSVQLICDIVQKTSELIDRINDIIREYKHNQLEVQQLEVRSKKVDELYTIVSKELMVIVLQEYLPLLSDIINNLLSKVVHYQLHFQVNTAGDKLEIMIRDEQGLREVKSLSGGQRTVLRLCWIFAIALRSRNKFLFLDETINHLDKEMVSKAAELIEDFVEGNKVTLYIITHSDQIQELDIWDHKVLLHR